jgi:hypothetical protein
MREDGGRFGIDIGGFGDELPVEHEVPDTGTGAVHQHPGVRVADERVLRFGLGGTCGSDHDGGGSDTGRDIPGVVMRAQRAHVAIRSIER